MNDSMINSSFWQCLDLGHRVHKAMVDAALQDCVVRLRAWHQAKVAKRGERLERACAVSYLAARCHHAVQHGWTQRLALRTQCHLVHWCLVRLRRCCSSDTVTKEAIFEAPGTFKGVDI